MFIYFLLDTTKNLLYFKWLLARVEACHKLALVPFFTS